jgi:hypothetical protein
VETKRRILVFGDTQLLHRLAAALRDSPLLIVEEHSLCAEISTSGEFHPDVILVDGGQIMPEQFHELLASPATSQSTLISIDPLTCQLTILSPPRGARPMEHIAHVIEILSLSLPTPT